MKAITFNLLAWVMLPIMDGFAKYLSADMPVLQITWARYFFHSRIHASNNVLLL